MSKDLSFLDVDLPEPKPVRRTTIKPTSTWGYIHPYLGIDLQASYIRRVNYDLDSIANLDKIAKLKELNNMQCSNEEAEVKLPDNEK